MLKDTIVTGTLPIDVAHASLFILDSPMPGWIEDFLTAKVAAGLSTATIRAYRQRLYRFRDWLNHRPLERPILREYLAQLRGDCKLSAYTVAGYMRDVVGFCNWLQSEKLISSNPAKKLSVKVPKHRPASYRPDHIHALLAVCDLRDRAIVITLLDTGLRVSELTSLKRTSIDWASGWFTIIGKGDKEREGWLCEEALDAIATYLRTRTDTDPALWIGRCGPLTPNGAHQAMQRRFEEAGIRHDVRRLLHSFRATFAKNYIKQGGDLESLRELLGHSTIDMSAHYAQLAKDELAARKRQVNPLAAALRNEPS